MSILAKYTLKLCATQCVRYAWLVLCTYMHMRWNFQSWIISAIGAVKEKNVTSARTKKNATNIVQEREKEIVCVCVSAFISAYNCTIFFYLPYTYRRVVWHTRKHQSLPPPITLQSNVCRFFAFIFIPSVTQIMFPFWILFVANHLVLYGIT